MASVFGIRRPLNSPSFNVKDFGAVGDGETDDSDAFEEAIATMENDDPDNDSRGRGLVIPFAQCRLSRALTLPYSMVLEGASLGESSAGTILKFDQGTHGIIVDSRRSSSEGHDAAYSVISRLSVQASNHLVPLKHGIIFRSRCRLSSVVVTGFSGNGIHGVSGDGNVCDGNALWKANKAYTIGDWVMGTGTNRNMLASVTGNLALTANPNGSTTEPLELRVITINRSTAWSTTPTEFDRLIIPTGSVLAGAANANVGMYTVSSATSTSVTATKLADDPYASSIGIMTNPVNVSTTAMAATTDVQAFSLTDARFCCIQSGTSAPSGSGPTGTGSQIADGSCYWRSPAASGSGPSDMGNANSWMMDYVRASGNFGHGVYIEGSDVNAGVGVGVDVSVNAGCGVFDNSFLGNTWIAPHSATNGLAPYQTSTHRNARCLFLGAYVEGDQTGSKIYAPSLYLGGLSEPGQATGADAFSVISSVLSAHQTSVSLSGKTLTAKIGRASAAGGYFSGFEVDHTDDTAGIQIADWDANTLSWCIGKTNYGRPFKILGGDYSGATQLSNLKVRAVTGAAGVAIHPGSGYWSANGNPLLGAAGSNCFRAGDLILNQNCATDGIWGWKVTANCGSGAAWSAGSGGHTEGTTVTPTTPNNYVYRRHSSSTSGAYTTGSVEPTWPTTPGQTVAEASGGIVWECWGRTDTGLTAL